jgi:hypothetical protein
MTLLVGAPFPWRALLEYPVFRAVAELGLQRGAILAADSRWTRRSGAVDDNAVKLFGVGTNGLAGYAGNAAAGEDAIKELSVDLPGRTVATYEEMSHFVTLALQRVWARHSVLGGGLHILLGASDRHGGCWLGNFSHEDDFEGHSVNDIQLLGPEAAKEHFMGVLDELTTRELSGPSGNLSLRWWAAKVTLALYDTCEAQAHVGVGGKFLCGITSNGTAEGRGLEAIALDSLATLPQKLTVDPLKARTLRKGWEYVPPPEGGDLR